MGELLSAYILPHPPIIIPEIGRGDEGAASKTVEACRQAAKDIASMKPETVIIITPHGPAFKDAVSISVKEELTGSFKNFRRPDITLDFQNDTKLVKKIVDNSQRAGVMVAELNSQLTSRYKIDSELDHGALVPLYFIDKEYSGFKLVHICMGFLSLDELFTFGSAINDAIKESGQSVVIVASGDLSHKLSDDGPYGYNKHGKEFDELFIKLLEQSEFNKIIAIDEEWVEEAAQCGLRPFTILFGVLRDYEVKSRVLSYEGPFGVGYGVAIINVIGRKSSE